MVLETLAVCQLEIWVRQRHSVRPSRLTSKGGQVGVLELDGDLLNGRGAEFGIVDAVDASQCFFSGARRCEPRCGGRLLRAAPTASFRLTR